MTLDRERQAAEALSRADPLSALNALAAEAGPHARALRGIALAQIQELDGAQRELGAAAAAFEDQPVYRARALAALAEVAAARREIGTAVDALACAADDLERVGDARNAAWARLVRVRILLLTGAVDEARADLERVARAELADPVLVAAYELARANTSLRVLSAGEALEALDRALSELSREEHPLLAAELDAHREALTRPLALLRAGAERCEITLPQLATVFRGSAPLPVETAADSWLVVDAIARRVLFSGEDAVELASRNVLFRLLEQLALGWPAEVETRELIERVFDGPRVAGEDVPSRRGEVEASYRDRLRVEIARLREQLPPGAGVEALGNAWTLTLPARACVVHVALSSEDSALTALLADGSAWAARDLALAIGVGQRSVQRALKELEQNGAALPLGQARARRWVGSSQGAGIASQMLLVSLLSPRR